MKKFIISVSLAAFFSGFGLHAEEMSSKTLDNSNVQKPKKENILNLLNKAKRELTKKNKEAKVYTANAGVDTTVDDVNYYDFLTSAYNQAVLDLKAQLVLKKSGTVAFSETFSLIDTRIPDEKLRKQLKEEADKKIQAALAADNMDGVFGAINNLIDKAFGNNKTPEEKKKIVADVKKQVFNKAFSEGFNKQASDEISGLIPYENFIVTNENGNISVGVLAYTTPRSVALARDLKNGNYSKKTENTEQCKSVEDVVDNLSDEELLSKFGIKFFYNENCRPSLLAYGLDSYTKTDGMNQDYEKVSVERARGMADKFISNFMSSNVSALINDKKIADKTIEAMMTATSEDGNTNYSNLKKTDSRGKPSIVKQMSQEFSSNSSMDLIGLEDARIWTADNDDYVVVGVIRYYSMDSINDAIKEFSEPAPEKSSSQKPKQKQNPSVKRSNNLDVNDF